MAIIIIEFKARCSNIYALEQKLQPLQPRFAGEAVQTDTYFNVPNGRLKLRESPPEHALIHYQRSNVAGAKKSEVMLYKHNPPSTLKDVLAAALGIKVTVQKLRRIFFVNNVKLHFDTVDGLGYFVEAEAIDEDGSIGEEKLQQQCNEFIQLFGIADNDFVAHSYSDMVQQQAATLK